MRPVDWIEGAKFQQPQQPQSSSLEQVRQDHGGIGAAEDTGLFL